MVTLRQMTHYHSFANDENFSFNLKNAKSTHSSIYNNEQHDIICKTL